MKERSILPDLTPRHNLKKSYSIESRMQVASGWRGSKGEELWRKRGGGRRKRGRQRQIERKKDREKRGEWEGEKRESKGARSSLVRGISSREL